jgi:hypothetical protein
VGFLNDFAGIIDEDSKSKMEEIIKFVEEKNRSGDGGGHREEP